MIEVRRGQRGPAAGRFASSRRFRRAPFEFQRRFAAKSCALRNSNVILVRTLTAEIFLRYFLLFLRMMLRN